MARNIGSRYTAHQILGRGSAGTVWLGEGPEGPVAIKLLREDLASDQELVDSFDYPNDPERVLIDFSHAHVWDASAVAALDAIEQHYSRHGCTVEITGLNDPSAELHETLSGQMAAAH